MGIGLIQQRILIKLAFKEDKLCEEDNDSCYSYKTDDSEIKGEESEKELYYKDLNDKWRDLDQLQRYYQLKIYFDYFLHRYNLKGHTIKKNVL